mgnify:CR=1 FL=1
MLQGQKDLITVGQLILSELAPVVGAQHGRVLRARRAPATTPQLHAARELRLRRARARTASELELGEGLVGQCAIEKQKILLTNVPRDYFRIASGPRRGARR